MELFKFQKPLASSHKGLNLILVYNKDKSIYTHIDTIPELEDLFAQYGPKLFLYCNVKGSVIGLQGMTVGQDPGW